MNAKSDSYTLTYRSAALPYPKHGRRHNAGAHAEPLYSFNINAHTTRENNICQSNAQRTNEKIPSKHSKTTFAQFTRKPKRNSQRNTTLLLQLCPYMQFTDITRTCITHSASLACLETKTSTDTWAHSLYYERTRQSSHAPRN